MSSILRNPLRYQDFYVGAVMIAIAAAGLLDITYGNWRTGQTMGPQAFPQVAYIAIMMAGGLVAANACIGKHDARQEDMLSVLVTAVVMVSGGVLLFLLAGRLGFTVALALALVVGSSLLTREPLRHWKTTILLPIVAAVIMYVLFVQLIRIPLPGGLLF
ncbi:tripartite tricarboxylate transporter TctB family protein [Halomonas sp. ML-15]|uniref:tripartite tricarboxylate transporter TctB family protein n=1 Tax=Halomonas sp. ML-15 TaxID=2773305 RepID=UPI00174731CB|nr:tripartite tricarboxylate transporter TctB family protein [Halomonas sp. ML-15]MBD3898152.1 tripartite tricarboxylate transporter TctB family protein [Halomonas sp. ML-15]